MSETRVMTLTDFLLARIAEDESAAQRAGSFTPWGETFQNDNYGHLTIQPSRVLAECAAKRLIVADLTAEQHEVVEDCWYTCPAATEERDGGACCREEGDCDCGRDDRVNRRLGILASVYAEHPDYRQEWKP